MNTPSSASPLPPDPFVNAWPGERLGLPQSGPGSIARFGRRLAALCIDWTLCYLVSFSFFAADPMATLAIFFVSQSVLIPTAGGSIGHMLLGMRVCALQPRWVGFWRPALRSALLCALLPALIWDADQRGFHDKIAGTLLVRVS